MPLPAPHIVALATGLLLSGVAAAPAGAAEHDEQLWLAVQARGELADDIEASAELSVRFGDAADGVGTGIARGSIGYRVSDAVSLDAGFGRYNFYQDGDLTRAENRTFQTATWRMGRALGGQWTSRTRLEQRMFEGFYRTGWRLRQRIAYARPIAGDVRLALSTESFLSLNDTDYGARNGIEIQRSVAAVIVPLARSIDTEFGYTNQWTFRRGREDAIAHAATIALVYKF